MIYKITIYNEEMVLEGQVATEVKFDMLNSSIQ